ncbi:MAG: DUF2169 domain-containing protein [Deltaproteobacteria bacterium]|nr:DUF2169 domain-containing protein [Deltaproteobacteria bacterium]MBK8240065.1 DUF2169 domain-containing protein [Deltaproteobacteria bacterium]MBP7286676.1 DUF2169 domain-containing protein [Nannocystaceae bacterium]
MTRTSARETYDATVGLLPRGQAPQLIFAIVKITIDLGTGRRTTAQPLLHDVWDPATPARLAPGSDYWIDKPACDVTVVGDAIAPAPVRESAVGVRVGNRELAVRVLGPRVVEHTAGRVGFSEPEHFERMPVTWAHAYGGADLRVPVPPAETLAAQLERAADHPGVYPRNPMGRGYVVGSIPAGLQLPNLEDPARPLTPELIAAASPEQWYLRPPPVCFELVPPFVFPRCLHFGVDAWYPAPDDERLAEVRSGALPRGFRGAGLPELARQEAAAGLAFPELPAGTPFAVAGMSADARTLTCAMPAAPHVEIALEGRREQLLARPQLVVLRPNENLATFTFAAVTTHMHRRFIPGIHRTIPLTVSVDGDAPIDHAPPPVPAGGVTPPRPA